jgi:hypothetical protein
MEPPEKSGRFTRIGESFSRGVESGINRALIEQQARQLAEQNASLALRERSNSMIGACPKTPRSAWISCIADHYATDEQFRRGLYVLLAELPPEQAQSLHAEIRAHAAEPDPLAPYRAAMRACMDIPDEPERIACADAVVSSVPERLR